MLDRSRASRLVAAWRSRCREPAGGAGTPAAEDGAADRLGPGPGDAEPVRRPRRGGLHDLGDELGPARQLQPRGPDPAARASPRAGRSPTTRRPSPSSSTPTEVVRRRADHLRRRQVVARGARRRGDAVHQLHRATSPRSRPPTTQTVVIHTKRPDARIVGGLFIYILPEHIWGKVPIEELTGSYKPELPLVGSGPYIVTEFERGRIITDGAQPELARRAAGLRRDPVHQVRHPGRGRAGAAARRDRHGRSRSRPPTSSASATEPDIETLRELLARLHRARLQPLPGAELPGRGVQPGRPGPRRCARRSPTRSTASGSTRSRPAAPRSSPTGSCPPFYKSFYEVPEQNYPYDPDARQPDARRRGLGAQRRRCARPRTARRSRSTSTCARSRRRRSRRRS